MNPQRHSTTVTLSHPARPGLPARPATARSSAGDTDPVYHLYLRELGQIPFLTAEEENSLARRVQQGDDSAREQLIKSHLRLVVKVARDYDGFGVPLLDLISEGNIGLMKAADRFDAGRGARFAAYAVWWVRQSVRRALANQLRTIRLPSHAEEKLLRLSRIALRFHEDHGREATDGELAAELGLPEAKVRRLRTAAQRPVSLDSTSGDPDDRELAESIADERSVCPARAVEVDNTVEYVRALLAQLPPRERTVLTQRFGLDGDAECTFQEIGDRFGVTRECVRVIQNRALARLRRKVGSRETRAALT